MDLFDEIELEREEMAKWMAENCKVAKRKKKIEITPFLNFLKSMIFIVIGRRGAGKSSFLAKLAETAYEEGLIIFDTFAAEDFENCSWVVMAEKAYPCIFIMPRYVDIVIPKEYQKLIKIMYDDEPLEQMLRVAKDEKRVLVFVNSAYYEDDRPRMFEDLAGYYKQIEGINESLGFNIFIFAREMRQISQGAGKVKLHVNAEMTKAALILLSTTCRHHHISLGLDGQFFSQSDSEIVDNYDRVVIKRSLSFKIPDKLQAYSKESRTTKKIVDVIAENGWTPLEALKPEEYYQLYDTGELHKDTFSMPKFHLKKETEFFQLMTGIKFNINEEKFNQKFKEEEKIEKSPHEERLYRIYEKLKKGVKPDGKPLTNQEIAEQMGFNSGQVLANWASGFRKRAGIVEPSAPITDSSGASPKHQ
jgi:hypothetical protein